MIINKNIIVIWLFCLLGLLYDSMLSGYLIFNFFYEAVSYIWPISGTNFWDFLTLSVWSICVGDTYTPIHLFVYLSLLLLYSYTLTCLVTCLFMSLFYSLVVYHFPDYLGKRVNIYGIFKGHFLAIPWTSFRDYSIPAGFP